MEIEQVNGGASNHNHSFSQDVTERMVRARTKLDRNRGLVVKSDQNRQATALALIRHRETIQFQNTKYSR